VDDLVARFGAHDATVGIIGLGYVGLPLAATFAEGGFRVIGFDVDQEKISALLGGRSYIHHIPVERLKALVVDADRLCAGKIHPTIDYKLLADCDAILICVPTPLTENREPDLSYVVDTARAIATYLRRGQLIVLESTTYPGTTDEVLRDILEAGGLEVGRDFHLAFSPEREDPNNAQFSTKTIPKLVGGVTPHCGEVAVALYGAILESIVPVASSRVAEAAKLLENIYRSVNIALVNELKVLFDRMGLNVWDVIDAAATKPFGFTPFYPGPGLGGHCIPIDPFYLTWKARQYEMSTRFIELAGEVNRSMPEFVVSKIADALNERCLSVKGAKVLLVGVAYKKDIDDTRESPALRIMELLLRKGADVVYHDPYAPILKPSRHYDFDLSSIELTPHEIARADVVLIATDHACIDYQWLVQHASLVVDARNATRHVQAGRDRIVLA